ncbi:MAG: MBL fold metallo-hydrolase [Firmicutes bacterium]|nr:MBL fold metallo-hydrolase [Bacillota bacterium]
MFITDSVYLIEATKGSFAYAIRHEEGITIIDSSMPGRANRIILELTANQFTQVKQILLTHHDIDHIGNAALLQEKYHCDVYLSNEDLPYMLGTKKREGVKRILSSFIKPKIPVHIKHLPQFALADIQIFSTPGHTPGHTCFLFEDVLFVGDLLNSNKGVLNKSYPLMTWDMKKVNNSIQAMNKLHFSWVCPAHGEPVHISLINI